MIHVTVTFAQIHWILLVLCNFKAAKEFLLFMKRVKIL